MHPGKLELVSALLEERRFALMLFRRRAAGESAEVAPLAGLWIAQQQAEMVAGAAVA